MIVFCEVFPDFLDLPAQALGFYDFKMGAECQQFLDEIQCDDDEEGEDGVSVGLFDFFLGVMDGEAAQVVGLGAGDFDFDALWFNILRNEDAEEGREEGLGVEVVGQFEGVVGDFHVMDAVEGEDAELFVLVAGEQVPPALEYLDGVGLDVLVHARTVLAEFVVKDVDGVVFAHGADDGRQELTVAGDFFEQHAPVHFGGFGFVQHVAQRDAVEQPFLEPFGIVQLIAVADVIAVGALVAVDDDAENAFKVGAVVVKSAARIPLSVGKFVVVLPFFADFLQCQPFFTGSCQRVHQPNVAVKRIFYHNADFVAKVRKEFDIGSWQPKKNRGDCSSLSLQISILTIIR